MFIIIRHKCNSERTIEFQKKCKNIIKKQNENVSTSFRSDRFCLTMSIWYNQLYHVIWCLFI